MAVVSRERRAKPPILATAIRRAAAAARQVRRANPASCAREERVMWQPQPCHVVLVTTLTAAAVAEPLGREQRVDEVDPEPRDQEPGERIVEKHASLLRDDRRRRRSRPTARRRRVRWRSWRYPT